MDYFVGNDIKRAGYGLPQKYVDKYSSKVTFLNGGMENIPSNDNTFDATTCISVMEHVVIDHKTNPEFHLKCLSEMNRVLKPGGLLICTYDTILNKNVVYSDKYGWGEDGWYYGNDIKYLESIGMKLLNNSKVPSIEEILINEDTFFIPPDILFWTGIWFRV